MTGQFSGTDAGNANLTITDGTTTGFGINKIIVSAGTLSGVGNGQCTIATGGGGGGGSGTVNSGTQYQVAYYASNGTAVSGNAGLTFNDSTQVVQNLGATAKIQTVDTTNNYAVTLLGGGGPRVQFGDIDSSDDAFMEMGAYGGVNNIDTQSRDFRIFGTSVGTMQYFDESSGFVGIGSIFGAGGLPITQLEISSIDASANTVLKPLTLSRTITGSPTFSAGIGVGMQFVSDTAVGNKEIGATIEAITTDVSSGSEDFDLTFNVMAAGATASEQMRIKSTGGLISKSNIISVSSTPTSVNASDTGSIYNIDTGSGDITLVLPTAVAGLQYVVFRLTSGNTITIDANAVAGTTINGATTYTLSATQYKAATVWSDGLAYYAIGE